MGFETLNPEPRLILPPCLDSRVSKPNPFRTQHFGMELAGETAQERLDVVLPGQRGESTLRVGCLTLGSTL